jgi:hypothetical protein
MPVLKIMPADLRRDTQEFLHKSRFALPKRRIESRHLKLLVLARFLLA